MSQELRLIENAYNNETEIKTNRNDRIAIENAFVKCGCAQCCLSDVRSTWMYVSYVQTTEQYLYTVSGVSVNHKISLYS